MSYKTYRFFYYLLQATNLVQILSAPKKERWYYTINAAVFLWVVTCSSPLGIVFYIAVAILVSYFMNRQVVFFSNNVNFDSITSSKESK